MLFPILEPLLARITPAEQKMLAQKWLQQERPAGQERHLQWIFFFVVESLLLCLALNWLWQNELKKQVALRTRELKAELAAAKRA